MPTARPIMVMKLTTKNERSKARPTSAVSPMAVAMAAIASKMGSEAATAAPMTMRSTTRATTMPIDSPLRRPSSASSTKSLLIVTCPKSRAVTPGWCVDRSDGLFNVDDMDRGLVEVGIGKHYVDEPRLPVCRNHRLSVLTHREDRLDAVGPQTLDGSRQLDDVCLVDRVVGRQRRRADNDDLVEGLGSPEPLLDELLRTLRLGIVGELEVRSQRIGEKRRTGRAGQHDDDHPSDHDAPRPATAGTRQRLGVDLHVLPSSIPCPLQMRGGRPLFPLRAPQTPETWVPNPSSPPTLGDAQPVAPPHLVTQAYARFGARSATGFNGSPRRLQRR